MPAQEAMPGWRYAIDAAALEDMRPFGIVLGGRSLLLLRTPDGIRCFERACPHEGADLASGWCEGGRMHCPHHRASFDLVTGEVSPGWRTRPLRRFAVRIVDGAIFVAGEPDA